MTHAATPNQSLSESQRHQLERRVDEVIHQIEDRHDVTLPALELRLDVRGSAWGYYSRKGQRCSVRLNPVLCAEHFEETLSDVIPHELAHFAVDQMYLRRRKPHGPEWRKVMQSLGIADPSVTHVKDVSHLAIRRQTRHAYRCDCQLHQLTSTRHNRVLKGIQQYQCRRCGSQLSPSTNDDSGNPADSG